MDARTLKPSGDLAKLAKPPFPGESAEYHKARETLYAADASNPVSAGDLAFTLNKLGLLAFNQADFASARARYKEALELRRDVVRRDAKNAMNRRGLCVSLGMVSGVPVSVELTNSYAHGAAEHASVIQTLSR